MLRPLNSIATQKITADPAKCAAYLKQSGEAPSLYEQVFNLVKGYMQVAIIVDKVDIRKDQYQLILRVP